MNKDKNIGGQAVIEGVMMRGPKGYSIAVRKPDGSIDVKCVAQIPIAKRYKFLDIPFFRGAINLIEMLIIGIKALSHSANIAVEEEIAENKDENPKPSENKGEAAISNVAIAGTMMVAFAFAVGLFIILPNLSAHFIGNLGFLHLSNGAEKFSENTSPLIYNLISGFVRILVFGLYIYAISFMKDIQRLFQYHGAEHKSIYAFEADNELTVENTLQYTTLHPRCGTSFLFVVMFIAILIFSVVPVFIMKFYPNFGNLHLAIQKIIIILLHIVLMPIIAGISYEIIKFASKYPKNPILKLIVLPGMLFQKVTTKEPDKDQLEVAIAALIAVLGI